MGNDTDIESFLKFASAKISKDLSLLYSTPSGEPSKSEKCLTYIYRIPSARGLLSHIIEHCLPGLTRGLRDLS